jgi:hypothetical protein
MEKRFDLKLSDYCTFYMEGSIEMCSKGLYHLFDIPEGAPITLIISDKPFDEAYAISFKDGLLEPEGTVKLSDGTEETHSFTCSVDQMLRHLDLLDTGTYYVGVEI